MYRHLLLCTILLQSLSHTAHAEEWLQSEQLMQMVNDNTAVCQHVTRPSSGRTYYDPDGTMIGFRRGEARSGTWYIEGDTLCTNWGVKAICSRYLPDGKGGHYKYTLSGKRVVHIVRWLEGERIDPQ